MKKLLLAGISLLFATSTFASDLIPGDINVDLGITQFTKIANGTWYQDGFDHTLHLTSPSVSIEYLTPKTSGDSLLTSGWQFGVGYDYIGRASSSALATASDANYNANSPTHCNGACWPLSHWYGNGTVNGVFLATRKNFASGWFTEVEYYRTRPNWEETIPDWIGCATCTPSYAHVDHYVRNIYNFSAAFGYHFNDKWSAIVKAVPTHASNLNQDGQYYPGIYKAYSPTFAAEYKF